MAESNGADLAFCPKFTDEDQKKGLQRKILGSVFAFTRVFCPGTKFYSCLRGAQAVFWGAQAPKFTPVAPGQLLSFGAQPSLGGGHIFRLGLQGVIWLGQGPEMPPPPPWRRACANRTKKIRKRKQQRLTRILTITTLHR